MPECKDCGEDKPEKEFYARDTSCKVCRTEITNEKRRERKQQWREYINAAKGNKCVLCGYDRHEECLELHHLHPHRKTLSFSKFVNDKAFTDENKVILNEELRESIRICRNCHAEIHAKDREV